MGRPMPAGLDEGAAEQATMNGLVEDIIVIAEIGGSRVKGVVVGDREAGEDVGVAEDQGGDGERGEEAGGSAEGAAQGALGLVVAVEGALDEALFWEEMVKRPDGEAGAHGDEEDGLFGAVFLDVVEAEGRDERRGEEDAEPLVQRRGRCDDLKTPCSKAQDDDREE